MSKKNNIKDANPGDLQALNAFKLRLVSDCLNDLMGKVLTVIDASVEGEKNKAMKDIIRNEFYSKHGWFAELAWKELKTDKDPEDNPHVIYDWEPYLVALDGKVYHFKK